MKKIIALALPMALLLTSCGRFGNKEIDGTKDMRIVCLSKHLTEIEIPALNFAKVGKTFPELKCRIKLW